MLRRLIPIGLLLLSACAEEAPAQSVEGLFVVSRLAVDPATELGEIFQARPDIDPDDPVVTTIDQIFDRTACYAERAIAFSFSAQRTEERGEGCVALALVARTSGPDLCGQGLEAEIDPDTFEDLDERRPWVQGPLFIEGQTLDARLSIGDVPLPGAQIFPRWWTLRARLSPPAPDRAVTVSDAELSTAWPAGGELLFETPDTGERLLDLLIARGLQPDLDLDGDGLESFEDTDGDGVIDRCTDGDGDAVDGVDCPADGRFADGYDLRLRFRVYRVTAAPGSADIHTTSGSCPPT